MKRIGVIVVHGVGEQKRFEHLEAIACNLFRALRYDKIRKHTVSIQLRRGDQVPHLSREESWFEAPAIVKWKDKSGEDIEVRFREVHWADLDLPMTGWRWLKLVGWSLGVSGVRLFDEATVGKPDVHGMCPPKGLSFVARVWVRAELFAVSLLFFFILITLDLIHWATTKLSISIPGIGGVRGLIYNYLGDVKLYQDWFVRNDDHLETIGEKSRVAIRRRMVRVLAQTAIDVSRKEQDPNKLDGYYILAHSLGTVVAFNGLMETALALPNYLTEDEWKRLPDSLKQQAEKDAPTLQMPRRPPWLSKRDAADRAVWFAGLKGVLTMGSPLDKFAALWPAIVPVNGEPIPDNVPWINIADAQDIVAGPIDLFPKCGDAPGVGGLQLKNKEKKKQIWGDQLCLFTAHTSYWKAKKGKERLINRLIPWLEDGKFEMPEHFIAPALGKVIFAGSLFGLGIFLLWFVAFLSHCLFFTETSMARLMVDWLAVGAFVVFVSSIVRRLWEQHKFAKQTASEDV